jgi:beta-galactosidase
MMNLGAILAIIIFNIPAMDRPDWENPEVIEKNQVEDHTPLTPYGSLQEAIEGKREGSAYFLSLNGQWWFDWSFCLKEAPKDFYKEDFDPSGWDKIRVPSNWQMEGYGKIDCIGAGNPPSFVSLHPPEVPDKYNPIGCYRRNFEFPSNWKGRRVFLHFESVKSAFHVWINGKEVGYNQGSMTGAEFDITSFLHPGENMIAVRVYRYSDGTYMEDQDMKRLSGIYRDVYLYSTPNIHICDLYVITDLDENYLNALLKAEVEIKNDTRSITSGYTLKASLYGPSGKKIFEESQSFSAGPGEKIKTTFSREVINPGKWSAERPTLYFLFVELKDSNNHTIQVIREEIGFREVEIEDGAILINGEDVIFNGVNRHSWHPDLGRALTSAIMEQDVLLMKKFNINNVRTSHYCPDPEFLDLCDRYGIYVVDEANQEATPHRLSRDPAWKHVFVERATSMVLRDRNHPSVVFWSAGNEGGTGQNVAAMVQAGKELDPTRGWMYGHAGADWKAPFEDIIGPRYKNPLKVIDPTKPGRPSYRDEYSNGRGNSLEGIASEVELFRKYRRFNGGAIWDWINQGVRRQTSDGKTYFSIELSSICMNGLLYSTRKPQPELFELKKVFQPVTVEAVKLSEGRVKVTNHYNFTNLNALNCHFQLVMNDLVIQNGPVNFSLEPGGSRIIKIPLSQPKPVAGAEYWLNLYWTISPDSPDTMWADANHVVAWEQFKLPISVTPKPEVRFPIASPLFLSNGEKEIEITGKDFSYTFSRNEGLLSSIKFKGQELLKQGPVLQLWAKILGGSANYQHPPQWRKDDLLNLQRKVEWIIAEKVDSNIVRVEAKVKLITGWRSTKASVSCIYLYRVLSTGDLIMGHIVLPESGLPSTLPQVGVKMKLSPDLQNFTWYGAGPHGCYPGREESGMVDVYSSTVADQYEPFSVPQHHQNKMHVRWATLTNEAGNGLMVMGLPETMMQVSQFSYKNVAYARYTYELEPVDYVRLTISYDISGINARYQVPTKKYSEWLAFRPFSKKHSNPMDLNNRDLLQSLPSELRDLEGQEELKGEIPIRLTKEEWLEEHLQKLDKSLPQKFDLWIYGIDFDIVGGKPEHTIYVATSDGKKVKIGYVPSLQRTGDKACHAYKITNIPATLLQEDILKVFLHNGFYSLYVMPPNPGISDEEITRSIEEENLAQIRSRSMGFVEFKFSGISLKGWNKTTPSVGIKLHGVPFRN